MAQVRDLISDTFMWRIIESMPEYGPIENHMWRSLFPYDETPSTQLMWKVLRSEGNLAGFLSLRGNAIPVEKLGEDRVFADVANVGSAWVVDPEVIRQSLDEGADALVTITASQRGQELVRTITEHITEGTTTCLDQIERQYEYMAIKAVTGHNITWPPLDATGAVITNPMEHWNPSLAIDFDYTSTAAYIQNASALVGWQSAPGTQVQWNLPGADIVKDLSVINLLMEKTHGLNAQDGTIMCGPEVIDAMANNDIFAKRVRGDDNSQSGARGYLSYNALRDFILQHIGWNLVKYNPKPWTYRTWSSGRAVINPVDFWPTGKVVIIPAGIELGNMMHAPHETQGENYATGLIPWLIREDRPPYIRQGGVRTIAWPTFPHSEHIFVLDAFN